MPRIALLGLLLTSVTAFQLSGRRMNEAPVLIDGPNPSRIAAFSFAESGSCDDIGWCDQQGCYEENVPVRDGYELHGYGLDTKKCRATANTKQIRLARCLTSRATRAQRQDTRCEPR